MLNFDADVKKKGPRATNVKTPLLEHYNFPSQSWAP